MVRRAAPPLKERASRATGLIYSAAEPFAEGAVVPGLDTLERFEPSLCRRLV